ncbi:hypothetical protein TNCV_1099591 [Trichonephila clavipes]|nr:hypothetical protein TNCV_1099591 [Trichonephila clavipes]
MLPETPDDLGERSCLRKSGRGTDCFPRDRFVALNPSRESSVPLGIPPPLHGISSAALGLDPHDTTARNP